MKVSTNRTRRRRGSALLLAVFCVLVTGGLIAAMTTVSLSGKRRADVELGRSRARYLADGATEVAKKRIQTAVANWEAVPESGEVAYGSGPVAFQVAPTGFDSLVTEASGIQTIVTGYEVSADAEDGVARLRGHRLVNLEATPIFQFAVFYGNDLEINPGPNMTLGGRVHTNGDLHLGCDSTLTIDTNYLRAVGDVRRNRKDDPDRSDGTVRIRRWVDDPFDPSAPTGWLTLWSESQLAALGVSSTSGYDSLFTTGFDSNGDGDFLDEGDFLPWGPGALAYTRPPEGYAGGYGSTLMSAQQGVTEAVTLRVGSIDMFEEVGAGLGDHYWDEEAGEYLPGPGDYSKGYYHENAGLVIVLDDLGHWTALDGDGNDVSLGLGGAVTVSEIFDARQADGDGGRVRVVEVDVAALTASGHYPANGLVYAATNDPGTGTDSGGILLTNGAEIPAPLTVVSQNPIYVHGDFNTVDKKGAAVLADAVNLLSNAWDGTKAAGSGLPPASDTTFNLALVSGNHETVGSGYNGGLENLPRFHENWSGRNCNIKGSLVSVWESRHATGKWKYGSDRYRAPRRNWIYDTDFNQVANLPPFTPLAVTARDVAVW